VTVVVLTVGDDDAVGGELSAVGVVVVAVADVVGVAGGEVVGVVVGVSVGVSVGVGVADDVTGELDSPAEKRGSWNSIQPSR
jgi:hypothetical protein